MRPGEAHRHWREAASGPFVVWKRPVSRLRANPAHGRAGDVAASVDIPPLADVL